MNNSWEEMYHRAQIWMYDWADGLIKPGQALRLKLRNAIQYHFYRFVGFIHNPFLCGQSILLGSVFIYAAYLRFFEALSHVAPSMSDSYVVIAWLKYVDRKFLFQDGIYPQGFHIYLDYLHKFSALDPLYVVNYAGPLHTVLIALGIYFAVSRWTGKSLLPGLISVVIYGLLGSYLTSSWMRQAATNSQEFGFIFILPTLYFFTVYLKEGNRDELHTAAAGAMLTGLVHSLAFAYLSLGVGMLILSAWLSNPRFYMARTLRMGLYTALAGGISLIPVGIGLLMGKQLFTASAQFLTAQATVAPPRIGRLDYITLSALALLFLYILVSWRNWKNTFNEKFILLWGISSFLIYFYVGKMLNSEMIISRSGDLWTIVITVSLGIGWYVLGKTLTVLRNRWIELILGFGILVFVAAAIKPEPIIPYKMQYESSVRQYLQISTSFRRSDWSMVSEIEGYALSYGLGYHLMLPDLLDYYDPKAENLTRQVDGREDILDTPDIFIFQEKRVFRSLPELEAKYQERERLYARLDDWIKTYRENHGNLSLYYEDDNIRIYQIHQVADKEKTFQDIWNREDDEGKKPGGDQQ